MSETTSFRFELPTGLHVAAKVKAARTGISMAEICRLALAAWTQEGIKPAPKSQVETMQSNEDIGWPPMISLEQDVLTMKNGSTITLTGHSNQQFTGSDKPHIYYNDGEPDIKDEAYVAACTDDDTAEHLTHEHGGYGYQEGVGNEDDGPS